MKFAVAFLACLAVAQAQFYNRPSNSASAFAGFNRNQLKPAQPYRPVQPQPFRSVTPQPFRAVTPAPYRAVTVAAAPAPVIPQVPVAPVVPVPQVAPAPQIYSRVSADARSANIVKFGNEINPDGTYNYFYETENGIAAQEQGAPRNFGGNPPVAPDVAQGSYSYTSPEGQLIQIRYIADENGFQPEGNAIPTPPPVPPQIARALEYIARNARVN